MSTGAFDTLNVTGVALAFYRKGREATKNQQYTDAVRYYTHAFNAAGTTYAFKARVLEYRGECYWFLSDFDAAEADYAAAMTGHTDQDQIARARVRLGELAVFRGQYEQATTLYEQALKEGLAVRNLLVIGRARLGLGILSRRYGNTEQAITYLTQALAAVRQAGEARDQARVLTSLGRTRLARGEYQHALTAHFDALTIFESLNDRLRIVQTLNDIGECHQALYDIENAYHFHVRALESLKELDANLIRHDVQRNLGVDLVELGRYEEGLDYLQQALTGSRRIGNYEQEALALYNLARTHMRRSTLMEATETVTLLNEMAEKLNADRFRALAAFAQGELLFHQGDNDKATIALNNAMLAAQTSVDRGVLWKLHATMSHVVEDEAIAAVHLDIAADFIRQTVEPIQNPHLRACFVNAPPVLAVLDAASIDPDKLLG